MTHPDAVPVPVPETLRDDYAAYAKAKAAKSRWAAEEKELKERILAYLGYVPGESKPPPLVATTPDGAELFEVAVSFRKGVDMTYFKTHYPDIYAECEKYSPVKTLRDVADVSAEQNG